MRALPRLRRLDWGTLPELVVLAAVLAIAALISYTHLRDVWAMVGAPWSGIGPLTVDGLFAAAWLRMRRRRRQDQEVGPLAWVGLGGALAATLAGNIAAAFPQWVIEHRNWVAPIVFAWAAAAFALVWELVTGHGRRPAAQESPDATQESPRPAFALLFDHLAAQQWAETQQHDGHGDGGAGGGEPPAGDPVLPDPPSRDEPDAVLVADLRGADAAHTAHGRPPLGTDAIRARYGVGWTRATRLRREADKPPAGGRPHLVPAQAADDDEEAAG